MHLTDAFDLILNPAPARSESPDDFGHIVSADNI
jgi:hypothetical protein